MAAINTTLSIEFAFTSDNSNLLKWEQDSERVSTEPDEVYLRLYPAAPERLIVTSGSLSQRGISYKDHEEAIVFDGESSSSLAYSHLEDVTIQQIGSFYDKTGADTAVALHYDQVRNEVVSDIPCYGVAYVTYRAPYQSYLFRFSGSGCSVGGGQNQLPPFLGGGAGGGYASSTIVAINFTQDLSASITLTPTDCANGVSSNRPGDSGLPDLKLEVHKDYPPRVTGMSRAGAVMSAGCKIRLVPNVPATMLISAGSLRDTSTTIQVAPIIRTTEVIKDAVPFNATSSVKVKYQPSGSMAIDKQGTYFDKWGNSINPNFLEPGERVTEVDWIDARTYTNPRQRRVEADEIVAVTSGNKAIPIYGVLSVEYSIDFRLFDVDFEIDGGGVSSNYGLSGGFIPAYVLAFYNNQSAVLKIDPPTIKEI